MKKTSIGVIVVLVIAILIGFSAVGSRNTLVTMEEDVNLAASQVQTQLQRRSDLIPNFVSTVKGYAAHEEGVYTAIADARAKLSGAIEDGDVSAMNEANKELDSALSRLLVVVENYPELNEYEKEIKLLEEIFEKCEIEFLNEYSIFPSPDNDFIKGNHAQLLLELNKLESLMKKVDSAGIEIIYENPNFRFKDTTKNTFNFDMIKEIINDVSKSKIYNNMALLYTNDILLAFEDIISEGEKDRINLHLSEKEFKEQYIQILDLLEFVAEYDLASKVEDLVSSNITNFISKGIKLLQELGKEGVDKLTTFGDYPIITKIKKYKGFSINLIAEIYACLQLYNSMDLWLSRYRETELYKVAGEFLILKGVIDYV